MPVAVCDTVVQLLGWHVSGRGLVIVLVLALPALGCGFRCSGWGLRVTSVGATMAHGIFETSSGFLFFFFLKVFFFFLKLFRIQKPII